MSTPRASGHPTYEHLLGLCRSLPGVTEDVKWGSNLVFSVGLKMFTVFDLPDGEPLGFKVDPGTFEVLTQQPGLSPAPYMAKHHWIRVETLDTLPVGHLEELIEESHRLVAAKLSGKRRRELGIE